MPFCLLMFSSRIMCAQGRMKAPRPVWARRVDVTAARYGGQSPQAQSLKSRAGQYARPPAHLGASPEEAAIF